MSKCGKNKMRSNIFFCTYKTSWKTVGLYVRGRGYKALK